jgi:hypothetical protein
MEFEIDGLEFFNALNQVLRPSKRTLRTHARLSVDQNHLTIVLSGRLVLVPVNVRASGTVWLRLHLMFWLIRVVWTSTAEPAHVTVGTCCIRFNDRVKDHEPRIIVMTPQA